MSSLRKIFVHDVQTEDDRLLTKFFGRTWIHMLVSSMSGHICGYCKYYINTVLGVRE